MGSYYVNAKNNHWRILETYYVEGRRKTRHVKPEAYQSIGVNSDWTIEQAKEKISELNAQNSVSKKVTGMKVRAAERVNFLTRLDSAFLSPRKVSEFLDKQESDYRGKEFNKAVLSRWKLTCEIIKELAKPVQQYQMYSRTIYGMFIKRQKSYDTSKRVIKLLNEWGRFNDPHYLPIPLPKGRDLEDINEAYQNGAGFIGESEPLTPELLASAKRKLSEENYNWLYVSIWFGLRPTEVNTKNIKIIKTPEGDALAVYQSKLRQIPKDQRWKYIPILYPEQKLALQLWDKIKCPIRKTMKIVFGDKVYLYGGRKGFESLMIDEKGHPLEKVSSWMGHSDITTTWNKYRNKRKVRF